MIAREGYRSVVYHRLAAAFLAVQLVACSSSGPDNTHRSVSDRTKRTAVPDEAEGTGEGKAIVGRDAARGDSASHTDIRSRKNVNPAAPKPAYSERSERVMGFRLQLHSTTDHAEARSVMSTMRQRLDSLGMEQGRMDLVFDAPYYKLRYGDYLMKADADRERGVFHELGFPAAFVVRDHIVRVIRERTK
ncbi:MAG: SPOR domain-containing protein [Bacteroidia bacterium]|nr:SPOR domain-containing protein [Bacteroidia bacterium]